MPKKISAAEATYFLGFDGGGTKTDCVLANAEGHRGRARNSRAVKPRARRTRTSMVLLERCGRFCVEAGEDHVRSHTGNLRRPGRRGPFRRRAARDGLSSSAVFRMRAFASPRTWKSHSKPHSERPRESYFSRERDRPLSAATRTERLPARAGAVRGSATKEARSISGAAPFRPSPWPRSIGAPRPRSRAGFLSFIRAAIGISSGNRFRRMRTPFFRRRFPWSWSLAEKGDAVSRGILAAAAASLAGLAAAVYELSWAGATGTSRWRKWAARTAARNTSTRRLTRN